MVHKKRIDKNKDLRNLILVIVLILAVVFVLYMVFYSFDNNYVEKIRES